MALAVVLISTFQALAGEGAETTAKAAGPNPQRELRSLKEAAGDRFKLGVGVSHVALRNAEDAALIRQHFQILTPENCMKPQAVHPAEDRWNFEAADGFAAFARSNNLEIVGHCLVWAKDDRTDDWMKQENGQPVSRETLLRRLETHIQTVVGRYADVAAMWDVVNEALSDGSEGLLRDSVYSRAAGLDFIVAAFEAARAKDPDALLIYNDYNGHKPGKREKLIELLTQLKQRKAPVDAYGMQGHFELGDDSIPQLRETFDALRKLGLKVVVSELDIDVVTRSRWWAEGGKHRDELAAHDPYKDGLPGEIERKQIQQYVALFKLFDEYSDLIERVSFWNLHDGQSWLNDFPWRRTNYPLLFDRNRRPKPAFDAVYALLQANPPAHAPIERRDPASRRAHQQLLQKARQGRIDLYFQGDSITRRWGATDYPKLLAHWRKHFHGWNAANFAWGGDTTHHILWRMQNGELDGVSPKVDANDRLADSSGRLLPGVSSDGLHLEEPGYEIWAQGLIPILEEILGPRAKEDHAPPPTGNPGASRWHLREGLADASQRPQRVYRSRRPAAGTSNLAKKFSINSLDKNVL